MLQTTTDRDHTRVTDELHVPDATRHWDHVVVIANRAPVRHDRVDGGAVRVSRSSGGLVTAIEPLIKAQNGLWIGHGAGSADAAMNASRRSLPDFGYRLRYVALSDDDYRGYYFGFANEGLWPLCHDVGVAPAFRAEDFAAYRRANARFARMSRRETAVGRSLVLVQDYHLALAPRILRRQGAMPSVVAFWHIPWPRPRVFRSCPWATELLDGLLGSDIVGFQTEDDCLNFLSGCEALLPEAAVDTLQKQVRYRGSTTLARVYPVGVELDGDALSGCPPPTVCRDQIRRELVVPADVRLGVGIDRLDYTKGINEKFLAVERLLEERADLRGHFVLVQVAEPSRDCLAAYQATRAQLIATADRVNARYGTASYRPILLAERRHEPREVNRYYRGADLCYVGSLHDGMNLVAKEFVAARNDEQGVLVLSERAGAAQQLRAALVIDPRDTARAAAALARGLEMSCGEQAARMRVLRANVATFDSTWWADQLMSDAAAHRDRW